MIEHQETGCKESERAEKRRTYRYSIERLRSRVTIEQRPILHSEAVDTERRKIGLVRGTSHGWILDDELVLARIDVDLPDAPQKRVCYEDEVIASADRGHAIEEERGRHACYLLDDRGPEDGPVGEHDQRPHINGIDPRRDTDGASCCKVEHVRCKFCDAGCARRGSKVVEHNTWSDGERVDVEQERPWEGGRGEDLPIGAESEVFESDAVVLEDSRYGRFRRGCWWDVRHDRLGRYDRRYGSCTGVR